jgi:monoglucosyldiacylglycerol epimerase
VDEDVTSTLTALWSELTTEVAEMWQRSAWEGAAWVLSFVVFAYVLGFFATTCFDLIHLALHQCIGRPGVLGRLGEMHQHHHRFIDEQLRVNTEHQDNNLWWHVLPENATGVVMSFVFGAGLIAWGGPVIGVPALILMQVFNLMGFVGNFVVFRGADQNHVLKGKLPAPLARFWVMPSYHLLHHIHPGHFFSSYVPTIDTLLGLMLPVRGRTFAVTGASGAFGAPLCAWIERQGGTVLRLKHGVDWTYDNIDNTNEALARADVLVLAHGQKRDDAMAANCDSFVAFIERFKQLTLARLEPPQVWAVGSEIECHPHFGNETLKIYSASKRAYAAHARRYMRDRGILYRHIVPSAFTSPMGPGLMSGRVCAAIALFLIRRGFRYVPVTYTGVALLNFWKFMWLPAAPAPAGSADRLSS